MRKICLSVLLAGALICCQAAHGQSARAPAPILPFHADPDFLKLPEGRNFGEVLSIAVNSKGVIVVLNHPGTATTGPLYGNATTELWEFAPDGRFIGEIGHGVYGLAYGHSVRFDRYDNLWVVDKATNSVMKFNSGGRVVMNLGRRDEGFETGVHVIRPKPSEAVAVDGRFNGPTDVAWDKDDNIYVSDGYIDSRIAKFDKNGEWIRSWGSWGEGGEHADQNASKFQNPHNMQIDNDGNIYVADRGNRRIQVFDRDGVFTRFIFLNAPYAPRHPTLGDPPMVYPQETAPWALCITPGPQQVLFAVDTDPGRLYKLSLDGRILGVYGRSGRQVGEFNWAHGIACPSENLVYLADMNNWRVQRLTMAAPEVESSPMRATVRARRSGSDR